MALTAATMPREGSYRQESIRTSVMFVLPRLPEVDPVVVDEPVV
ncbi:hypothetical protein [Streptomyces sp. ISL-99]|nr:hypothetical protein [Streptomyces sp. ISL-99]